jgi:hypothetical protein
MIGTSQPRRRWLLYGLRALVVLMLLACIVRGWIAVKLQPVKQERAAAEAITGLGGSVSWTHPDSQGETGWRAWLRTLLGDDFFAHPDTVFVTSDAAMEYLGQLRQVPRLILADTQVTDAGLEHLKDVTQLEALSITGTQVTDAGLEHLQGLTDLRELWLMDTQVGDTGLGHLAELTQLQQLSFEGSQVTDVGLEQLAKLTQLQKLWITGTQLTGTGLEHLRRLTRLEQLYLINAQVNDSDVRNMQQAMPGCSIVRMVEDEGYPQASVDYRTDQNAAPVRLLFADAVQKDLELTADEMAQIADFFQVAQERSREYAAKWPDFSVGSHGGISEARSRAFAAWVRDGNSRQKELRTKLVEMLTPRQRDRLRQIHLQQTMALALTQPDYIKALGISDEQLQAIRSFSDRIVDQRLADLRDLDGMPKEERRPRQIQLAKQWDKAQAETNRAARDMLTPEQRSQLAELTGQEIEVIWDYDALAAAAEFP